MSGPRCHVDAAPVILKIKDSRPTGTVIRNPSTCLESVIVHDGTYSNGQPNRTSDNNIGQPRTNNDAPLFTASKIEFDEKISDLKAAARCVGQTGTNEQEIDKEHRYNTDSCQFTQAEVVVLGMPNRSEIQSMIVHDIIDYHAYHLFPVCLNHAKPETGDDPPSEIRIDSLRANQCSFEGLQTNQRLADRFHQSSRCTLNA